MRTADIPQIAALTTPEKILVLEALWEDIAADAAHIAIPQSHKEELDRRLCNADKNPGALLTLDELMARIEARK
jgi:putative addiction module component (TIGR02574 family)